MGLTRDELFGLSKMAAGDCFTMPNGDSYNIVNILGEKGFWKNGKPISEQDYRAANQAFFNAMPSLPTSGGPALPANMTPESLVEAFNKWGKVNITQDIFGTTPGYFTEEAVGPAKDFMAKTNFVDMGVQEAKLLIAKSIGYENPDHLGLEHQVQAAWSTLDGRIIFYCDLQGGMFLTKPCIPVASANVISFKRNN